MSHYDYENETLVLTPLGHAGRKLRYWVEHFTSYPPDGVIRFAPDIVHLGHGHDGQGNMRVFLLSVDARTDGHTEPTIHHAGLRS